MCAKEGERTLPQPTTRVSEEEEEIEEEEEEEENEEEDDDNEDDIVPQEGAVITRSISLARGGDGTTPQDRSEE